MGDNYSMNIFGGQFMYSYDLPDNQKQFVYFRKQLV